MAWIAHLRTPRPPDLPVAVVPPSGERAGARAPRWSALPDERPWRPGPGLLGLSWDDGDGKIRPSPPTDLAFETWIIPESETPAGGFLVLSLLVCGDPIEVLPDGGVVFEDVVDGLPVGGEPGVLEGFVAIELVAVEGFVGCDGGGWNEGACGVGVVRDGADTASEGDAVGTGWGYGVVWIPCVVEDDIDPCLVNSIVVVAGGVVDGVGAIVVVDESRYAFEGGSATVTGSCVDLAFWVYFESHESDYDGRLLAS